MQLALAALLPLLFASAGSAAAAGSGPILSPDLQLHARQVSLPDPASSASNAIINPSPPPSATVEPVGGSAPTSTVIIVSGSSTITLSSGASSASSASASAPTTTTASTGAASSAPALVSASLAQPASQPSPTPGFVNNGTIGTYPCALSNTSVNPLAYSPFSVPGCDNALPPAYPYTQIRLRANDNSIRATFLPYGATLSELWVKDRYGGWRDVVLGYDNVTNYGSDPLHPTFGHIVGRYANRIKNGTFSVDNTTYHVPLNENNVSSLHGGTVGYDRSFWRVSDFNSSWVQFTHYDADGNQGFPGAVNSTVDYYLLENATWSIKMAAEATKRTPIMLSSHVYWNLEAYNETQSILNTTLSLPQATQYVATDSILIPNGTLGSVNGTGFDFLQPTVLSERFNQTQGYCGANCTGWDNCWIMPTHDATAPVLEWYSAASGIKLSIVSDQPALQIYTCDGLSHPVSEGGKGSIPRKRAHGGDGSLEKVYDNHSCAVIEAQDYIDAINHPEWGRDVVYGPGSQKPYSWSATYVFSTVNPDGTPSDLPQTIAANADGGPGRFVQGNGAGAGAGASVGSGVGAMAVVAVAGVLAALL